MLIADNSNKTDGEMNDIIDHTDFCRECRGKRGFYEPTGYGTLILEDCDLCRGTGRSTVLASPKPSIPQCAASTAKSYSGGTNSAGGPSSCSQTHETVSARPSSSDISAAPTQCLAGASSLTEMTAGGAASKQVSPAIPFPNPRNHHEETANMRAEMEAQNG